MAATTSVTYMTIPKQLQRMLDEGLVRRGRHSLDCASGAFFRNIPAPGRRDRDTVRRIDSTDFLIAAPERS